MIFYWILLKIMSRHLCLSQWSSLLHLFTNLLTSICKRQRENVLHLKITISVTNFPFLSEYAHECINIYYCLQMFYHAIVRSNDASGMQLGYAKKQLIMLIRSWLQCDRYINIHFFFSEKSLNYDCKYRQIGQMRKLLLKNLSTSLRRVHWKSVVYGVIYLIGNVIILVLNRLILSFFFFFLFFSWKKKKMIGTNRQF